MNLANHPAMAEALRLTRAGRLGEATDLIQRALAGATAPPPAPSPDRDPDIIDLVPLAVRTAPRAPDRHSAPSERATAEAGRFEARIHHGAAGSLPYRLYVPHAIAEAMPLVIMLHGCTQSSEDFARGTAMNRIADELGFVVAYPGQTQAANLQKCWNWFRPGDQQRDRGEPALIAGITREIIAEFGTDRARVYVAGLSAGGAAAAVMGAVYPDLFAAIGIHSGLACGAAHDMPGALMAMRKGGGATPVTDDRRFVPVITFHGDRDTIVDEINSREIVAAASAGSAGPLRTVTETGRSAGGRRFTRAVHVDHDERVLIEQWTVHGAGHAWFGGDASGSYTDPSGPDASREMMRFFLEQKLKP